MGKLFRARVSTESVPGDKHVCAGAPLLSSEPAQPATLSVGEGEDILRALSTNGVSVIVVVDRATACECLRRRFQESRMQEICQSGLTRGERNGLDASLTLLLYWLLFSVLPGWTAPA